MTLAHNPNKPFKPLPCPLHYPTHLPVTWLPLPTHRGLHTHLPLPLPVLPCVVNILFSMVSSSLLSENLPSFCLTFLPFCLFASSSLFYLFFLPFCLFLAFCFLHPHSPLMDASLPGTILGPFHFDHGRQAGRAGEKTPFREKGLVLILSISISHIWLHHYSGCDTFAHAHIPIISSISLITFPRHYTYYLPIKHA